MLDKNDLRSVKVEKKTACWICDLGIQVGDHAVRMQVHIPVWGKVVYDAHKTCTADLRDLLDERLIQAGKGQVTP